MRFMGHGIGGSKEGGRKSEMRRMRCLSGGSCLLLLILLAVTLSLSLRRWDLSGEMREALGDSSVHLSDGGVQGAAARELIEAVSQSPAEASQDVPGQLPALDTSASSHTLEESVEHEKANEETAGGGATSGDVSGDVLEDGSGKLLVEGSGESSVEGSGEGLTEGSVLEKEVGEERHDDEPTEMGGRTSFSYEFCAPKLRAWHEEAMRKMSDDVVAGAGGEGHPQLKTLLFFLHIPRTGGRTYHQCFLKALYPPGERCPRSYDTLRLDPKKPECRLLSTHDDYSLMSKLPVEDTSVVTNVRDPADRLLSSYEFMVEIASRALRWQKNTDRNNPFRAHDIWNALEGMRKRATDNRRTETRSVWPWTYLVPLMEDDVWWRTNKTVEYELAKDAAEQSAPGGELPTFPFGPDNGSYDTPRMVMPLKEYVYHPLVRDLIEDGGTMQVAGLTNNSCTEDSFAMRSCAKQHKDLGDLVLEVAKARLDRMLYVGLTEAHKDSARIFAHVIGKPLADTPAENANVNPGQMAAMEHRNAVLNRHRGRERHMAGREFMRQRGNRQRRKLLKDPGVSLLTHYHRCVEQQRGKYRIRRDQSLRVLAPVTFNERERAKIPPAFMAEIRSLNRLDMELLAHARNIFKREQELHGGSEEAKRLEELRRKEEQEFEDKKNSEREAEREAEEERQNKEREAYQQAQREKAAGQGVA
eukprot:TRINITY_DN646_c0_g2_i1.p1 TRINITY_DN646_c0_g2~~TRINITY_DN646_c0_g2_i1.p1  ORF type:complete len:700 (-),score=130.00 TRINITY_DN646_c0_g2_i1:150-2249(-)